MKCCCVTKLHLLMHSQKSSRICLKCSFALLLQDPSQRGIIIQILESVYRFTLGAIAGGMCVFPSLMLTVLPLF